MFIVSRLLPQSGKQPYVPQQVENPALWSRSMSQWTAGYPVGGPGSEHMVALSCACLTTRGVDAVVICCKAGSSGGKCELWVWRIPATSALPNSVCVWIMPAVCAVESGRDEHPPIGGSHKCGAGEMRPREGTMMELNSPEGRQRLAGIDGSALCIKVAIERSASGGRMSTLKFSCLGKPEVNIFPDAKAPSGCRRLGGA